MICDHLYAQFDPSCPICHPNQDELTREIEDAMRSQLLLAEQCANAERERDELKADAERYRKFKSVISDEKKEIVASTADELDEALDAALDEKEKDQRGDA